MHLIQSLYQWLTLLKNSLLLLSLPILFKLIRRTIPSPISRLPGPHYTSLSYLPIIYQDFISNKTLWIVELHKQYGPIVRLSPSEVSVSSPDLIKEVFVSSSEGGGGYPKAPFFNIFQHFGARNALSSIGSEDHSWRRRLVGGLYTQTAVLRQEVSKGRLWCLVGDFLDAIQREGLKSGESGKAVDIHSYCTYYGTDGVTSYLFPPGSSSSALQGTKSHRSFIDNSRESPDEVITYFKMEYERLERLYILTRNFIPRMGTLMGLVKSVEIKGKRKAGRSRLNAKGGGKKANFSEGDSFYGGTEIEDWGFKRFLETKERVQSGIEAGVIAEALAKNVLEGEKMKASGNVELPMGDDRGVRLFENEEKSYYRDDGAASECMDQFLAGRDTTGDTLSYIINLLSQPAQAAVQSILHAEIQSLRLPESHSEPLSQGQLTNLIRAPYLDAIIKETLRIFPASTITLFRSVPTGGRTIAGFFIPENTVIGATPMVTNTSPIFISSPSINSLTVEEDINSWIPGRWIASSSANSEQEQSEKDRITEMERRIWTFGSGSRGCIGKHLAVLEMKLLLAGIYGRYRTEIDDESDVLITHDDWTKRNSFRDVVFFPDAKGFVRFVAI